ncbi:MAG: glycosyltransferase family 39 protein [Sedimentisphaerales bacterium]|nr:glycosyltransferase family 39 protein [Sedimentisphaerales bacterium]
MVKRSRKVHKPQSKAGRLVGSAGETRKLAVGGGGHSVAVKLMGLGLVLLSLMPAAVPFVMGKYVEFNSSGPFDSSAYVYSAYHILEGAQIGVEEKTSAQIGTLLVNMLGVGLFGFSEFGPKLIQMLLQGGALVFMYFAVRRLYGGLAGAVSVFLAALYLSSPIIAKFGNVKEQYMIAFMLMGMSCLVFRQVGGRWWWAVPAGALAAWAPLFKATGVSAGIAIGVFLVFQAIFRHRTVKQVGVDMVLLLVGAVVSVAPINIWMAAGDVPMQRPYYFLWKAILPTEKPRAAAEPPVKGDAGEQAAAAKSETGEDQSSSDSVGAGEKKKKSQSYVARSRELAGFWRQFPTVMRFYGVLILPISLALGAIVARIVKMMVCFKKRSGKATAKGAAEGGEAPAKDGVVEQAVSVAGGGVDRFVLFFGIWWILDMAFVWISPRSYEQYYLPLTASGAMLGAYVIGLYAKRLKLSANKFGWLAGGGIGLICMAVMCSHIFGGIQKSAHTGNDYGEKRFGLIKRCREVSQRGQSMAVWEQIADIVKSKSEPDDKIYVWGWYPGIYVRSGRLCSVPKAFESEMHVTEPETLKRQMRYLVDELKLDPPKYIVDSQKVHFPYNQHPVFDLWPRWRDKKRGVFDLRPSVRNESTSYVSLEELTRFQPRLNKFIEQYCVSCMTNKDRQGGPLSEEQAGRLAADEVARHEAMGQLREFVMKNYKPILSADSPMHIYEYQGTLSN